MPRPSGGSGNYSLFTSNKTDDGTVGSSAYVDLGAIPSWNKFWFGTRQYSSPDKSITFELRTNNSTKSAGTDGDTTLLGSISAAPRNGTVTQDYYKNGRLHTASVLSTGVEHCWLKLKSRSSTSGSYLYSINYVLE